MTSKIFLLNISEAIMACPRKSQIIGLLIKSNKVDIASVKSCTESAKCSSMVIE